MRGETFSANKAGSNSLNLVLVTETGALSAVTAKALSGGMLSLSIGSLKYVLMTVPPASTKWDSSPSPNTNTGAVVSGGSLTIFTVTLSPDDHDWPVPLHSYSLAEEVVPSLNFSVLVVPPSVTSRLCVPSSASFRPMLS